MARFTPSQKQSIAQIIALVKPATITEAEKILAYIEDNNMLDWSECSTKEFNQTVKQVVEEIELNKQIALNRKNGKGNTGQVTLAEIRKAEKQLTK